MKKFKSRNFLAPLAGIHLSVAFLFLMAFAHGAVAASPAEDSVVFTFVTMGDCRSDHPSLDMPPADRIWLEHTRPLARIIREVQAQKPNLVVFTGDTIMGQTTNAAELDREYAYWRGMMTALLEDGIYVVPVPGNHEVQVDSGQASASGKVQRLAHAEAESRWRTNMADLILDTNLWTQLLGAPVEAWDVNNTPSIGGSDGIVSDQRQLSFSFDFHGMHFAAINTDAVGQDSHAPTHWLESDLAAAKARGNRHFFVFGHKMAFTYQIGTKTSAGGLDAFPPSRDAFWEIIRHYQAIYFTSHEHVYHTMQPEGPGADHPWQVLAGSSGAPFEAKPGQSNNPNDRKYAWTLNRVYRSGRVTMEAYGFDEHYGPTGLIERIDLKGPQPSEAAEKQVQAEAARSGP